MKVPPGWTKGEPISILGSGPRYGIMRDPPFWTRMPPGDVVIVFDSKMDCTWWCAWWLAKPWKLSI